MKSTGKRKRPVAAETTARLADNGKDVSRFFTNSGRMMGPIQRVNVWISRRRCWTNWTARQKS